jgi:glutamate-1-semialdehyde 2,1-aminomutase
MDNLAPTGSVYQAGTLSGNPICVAAGIATLKLLKSQNPYTRLDRLARQLCNEISGALQKAGVAHTLNQIGSMFTLFFNPRPVTDYISATKSDTDRYAKYFKAMLKAGIYLPPSQFEACFISTKHCQKDFDETIAAVQKITSTGMFC